MNATGNGISVYAHNSNGQVKESDKEQKIF